MKKLLFSFFVLLNSCSLANVSVESSLANMKTDIEQTITTKSVMQIELSKQAILILRKNLVDLLKKSFLPEEKLYVTGLLFEIDKVLIIIGNELENRSKNNQQNV